MYVIKKLKTGWFNFRTKMKTLWAHFKIKIKNVKEKVGALHLRIKNRFKTFKKRTTDAFTQRWLKIKLYQYSFFKNTTPLTLPEVVKSAAVAPENETAADDLSAPQTISEELPVVETATDVRPARVTALMQIKSFFIFVLNAARTFLTRLAHFCKNFLIFVLNTVKTFLIFVLNTVKTFFIALKLTVAFFVIEVLKIFKLAALGFLVLLKKFLDLKEHPRWAFLINTLTWIFRIVLILVLTQALWSTRLKTYLLPDQKSEAPNLPPTDLIDMDTGAPVNFFTADANVIEKGYVKPILTVAIFNLKTLVRFIFLMAVKGMILLVKKFIILAIKIALPSLLSAVGGQFFGTNLITRLNDPNDMSTKFLMLGVTTFIGTCVTRALIISSERTENVTLQRIGQLLKNG